MATNTNQDIDLLIIIKEIWASRKRILKWGGIGILVGVIIAFSIPKEYQISVRIVPESSSSKRASFGSSMGGLASLAGLDVESADGQYGLSERIYPEIIKSTPFLLDLAPVVVQTEDKETTFYNYMTAEQKNPWWGYVGALPFQAIGWVRGVFSNSSDDNEEKPIDIFRPSIKQEQYVKKLQSLINVNLDKKLGLISITVKMQDPLIVAVIADSLLVQLQTYMTEYKTAKSRADLNIATTNMETARRNYYQRDSLYAVAADKNQNLISKTAKLKLERLENEKNLAYTVYQQLASQVEMSKVKLQADTPIATILDPASVPVRAASPNKPQIMLICGLLSMFLCSLIIVIKSILRK